MDFCDISTSLWTAILAASVLWGGAVGYALQVLFERAGFGLSASSIQNLAGGCLFPVAVGLLSGFAAARLIPDDPCGGAHTPDGLFVPLLVFLLTTIGSLGMFWIRVGRG